MPVLSQKLKRLNAAARVLATVQGRDELMERILDGVQQVLGRESAAVLLRDPDGRHLRIAAARGYDAQVVASYHAPVGRGVAGTVAATGEPRLVRDVSAEPDYVPGVSAARSEMAVPLTVDGEVIGVLDVESRDAAFGEEDMALLEAFGEQAAWALRHGQALATSAKRARRLDLLNRAACSLSNVHDTEELLAQILALAHEALGLNNVAVLLPDAARGRLVVRKALRPGGVEGMRIPVGQGVTGAVFRSGVGEIVPDVRADPRYISGGIEGTRSEMVAPLALNGEVIGVLDAEGDAIGSFGELDLELFGAFAAHVATALHNSRLLRDLEDRARRLRQIVRAGRALNAILDADQVLAEILDAVTMALGLQRVAVLLVDPARSELVVHAAKGYGEIAGRRIALGEGVTGHVAVTGEPALLGNVSADDRYLPGTQGGASEMAVPLRVRGELLGVLDTESPASDAFTGQDLDLFQAFADQAAVAINNARLFRRLEAANERLKRNVEEMSRLNRELETYAVQISEANTSLEQRVRQLTTLHQAGQAIASSLDLKHTLNAILEMTGEIVRSSAGAIKLLDEETKELHVAAQAGLVGNEGPGVTRLDLPLRIGERTIGVFEIVRSANDKLAEGERKMLETLASQAAVAIEKARLFEDTQRIYYDTLKSLAKALEARDNYTRGHSERVAGLSRAIAVELCLDESRCHLIYNSAVLHDIGKIGVRDAILHKPRKLTAKEMDVIRQHPMYGNVILGPLKFLGELSNLVKHHHESWDGSGYPDGLRGEQIPLESRIIAVADSYDAITSTRPYREARSHEDAVDEIRRQSGRQFDPQVVEAFLRVVARGRPVTAPPPPVDDDLGGEEPDGEELGG
ncbi:MAG: GAF domain-containing protein [Deltaproteobacteria bacterium]|nr:GAF domain-containing protein [Deltaproteobacteria bacterium]